MKNTFSTGNYTYYQVIGIPTQTGKEELDFEVAIDGTPYYIFAEYENKQEAEADLIKRKRDPYFHTIVAESFVWSPEE